MMAFSPEYFFYDNLQWSSCSELSANVTKLPIFLNIFFLPLQVHFGVLLFCYVSVNEGFLFFVIVWFGLFLLGFCDGGLFDLRLSWFSFGHLWLGSYSPSQLHYELCLCCLCSLWLGLSSFFFYIYYSYAFGDKN